MRTIALAVDTLKVPVRRNEDDMHTDSNDNEMEDGDNENAV